VAAGVNPVASVGFGKLAATYERGRPSYPEEALALLARELGIGPGCRVLDLAAGTGKFSRLLVALGADVVAVEPVKGMRDQLVANVAGIEVVDGAAEAIPLDDASVDVVTVAQAFHWFDAPAALSEMARVLREDGGLSLIWNERDESVPWVNELSQIIHWNVRKPYDTEIDWCATVDRSERFTPARHAHFAYVQMLDADTLVERVESTSYLAAMTHDERAPYEARVRALVAEFSSPFALPYDTHVYWCSKRPA
jgi:ubiquinone/menaquinone biosynthesis C-methylase UbiE